jgi:hypothetical protein
MTEISSAKRAIIIQYHFYDHLTFQDISSRLTDASAEAAKMNCFRAPNAPTPPTTTARKPLGEFDAKQFYNMTLGQLHSQADPIDSRPITRKRALESPSIQKLDFTDRKRYIEFILALDESKTILISCDETPLEFGGSGHTHVSAPRGEVVYADEASDPRFSKIHLGRG